MTSPRPFRVVGLLLALVLVAPTPSCTRRSAISGSRSAGASGVAFASLGLSEALAEAGCRDTLLMVDVYTEWCGWCRKLDKETFTDPEVVAATKNLVAIRLNPETQQDGAELARRYGIDGFPVVLFLRPDGAVAGRLDGYYPPRAFLEKMPKPGRT